MTSQVCQCACSSETDLPTGLLASCNRRDSYAQRTSATACTIGPTPAPYLCWQPDGSCAECCASRRYPYAVTWTGRDCSFRIKHPNVGLIIGLVLVPVVALLAVATIWHYKAQLDRLAALPDDGATHEPFSGGVRHEMSD
jgi:hypothetical protein